MFFYLLLRWLQADKGRILLNTTRGFEIPVTVYLLVCLSRIMMVDRY